MPQTEIFDVFERQRAPIVAALGGGGRLCDFVMEAVTRVVTFTGPRAPAAHALRSRSWRPMGNPNRNCNPNPNSPSPSPSPSP